MSNHTNTIMNAEKIIRDAPVNTTIEKKINIDVGRKHYKCHIETPHDVEHPSIFCKLLHHGDIVPNDTKIHSFSDLGPPPSQQYPRLRTFSGVPISRYTLSSSSIHPASTKSFPYHDAIIHAPA